MIRAVVLQKRPRSGHDEFVDYQIGVTPCPQCGSSDQVHTARQMFDIMNGASQQGAQQATLSPQPTAFGQPAPFGQPTPFGQPAPFGQPDQSQQAGQSQQPGQFPQPEPVQQPGQMGGWNGNNDGDYDHYNADGNGPGYGFGGNRSRRDDFGFDSVREGLADDIGGAG